MADISTPNISSVYKRIVSDFPDTSFLLGDAFRWTPQERRITHPPLRTLDDLYQLLHEVGHAMHNHQTYHTDISLIDIEREAWGYAISELAPRYNIPLSSDDAAVQQSLDSYRAWLHARSTCPHCEAIGIEQSHCQYRCLSCSKQWRVNEARTCGLKRHIL